MGGCGSKPSVAESVQNPPSAAPTPAISKPPSDGTAESSSKLNTKQQPINFGFARDFSKHFSVGKELGHGSFGTVRVVVQKQTNKRYAVKTILKSSLKDEAMVVELKNEIAIMKKLRNCLNVVNIHGVYETDTLVYMVLELCEGGEIYKRIAASKTYSEQQASEILRSILQTVAQCHANGIVHRDIKPENFLFLNKEEDSPIKAIDFGLASFYEPGTYLTETSGTPYYMAPEVIKRKYGPPADLWSVGVVMYLLLSGRLPFTDEHSSKSVVAVFRKILKGEYDVVSPPWDRISDSAKHLLGCLLVQHPAARPTALQALQHKWIVETIHQDESGASDQALDGSVVQRLQQFSTYSRLKQTTLRLIAGQMSADQDGLSELHSLFTFIDKDKSGSIEPAEFVNGLRSLGYVLTDEEVSQLMNQVDVDGDGKIMYDEFVTSLLPWKALQRSSSWREWLDRTFAMLDEDGDGFITADELHKIYTDKNASESMKERDIMAFVKEGDLNGDGVLSVEEFRQMVISQDISTLSVRAYDARLNTGTHINVRSQNSTNPARYGNS